MDITCYRASLKDVETLVEYRLKFLQELFPEHSQAQVQAIRKSLRDYFKKVLSEGTFTAWLAKVAEEVVATSGMVIWRTAPRFSVPTGYLGYILNMYTVPEWRGQGIATTLLKKLIDEAKKRGIHKLHLHASEKGESVYRKLGFVDDPLHKELWLKLEE